MKALREKMFGLWRHLPRYAALVALHFIPTHGHGHPIDEVRSNAILELQTDDRQHFQWLVLLGQEHLTEYARILRDMNQPESRDREVLAETVQRAFTFDGCEVRSLAKPAPGQADPRFSERQGGAWIGLHFAVECARPVDALTVRRVGYSAAKTRTTLYLAVAVAGRETVRALVPPTAEAMTVPLDGQPAHPLGPPVQRKSPAKDTAPGVLPSETMSPAQLAAARQAPAWRMPPASVLRAWAQEGASHLLTGPDHLLFLLTLVVAAPGLAALLAAVTAFSLGHLTSMTLALLLQLPAPRWVDIAIGGTIATAAWRARSPRSTRLWGLAGLTAAFGLIHGLGFGNGLQRLVAGYDQLVWPLLSFGLGLDAAQVCWVLLCTLLWRWSLSRLHDPARGQRWAAHGLVVCGGIFAIWASVGEVP